MKSRTTFALLVAGLAIAPFVHAQALTVYKGWCDASAAVALGPDHFVVANDERNELLVYRRGQADPVVDPIGLSDFLGTGDRESDLEGAALIGTRIYWIASHGRNKNAKLREERHRFFATDVRHGQSPSVAAIGKPYTGLLNDLLVAEQLEPYDLATAATLAPEAPGGLNIEGLAATPDGKLLIGFRSPVRNKMALVVRLENADELVKGGAKARFGKPIPPLDLGGRGIRSIELVGSSYLIVAGPAQDDGDFVLYRWSGKDGAAPTLVAGVDFAKYERFRPEALFAIPNTSLVQILSDDGERPVSGATCKGLDRSKQSFRSITIDAGK